MKHDLVIESENLGKCYQIYDRPMDRLKQSIWRSRRRFFREFWALRNVSLKIEKGETVGIIGSNGAGKSTLLQLICNILTPTMGWIEVNGKIAALLELGAGFNKEFTGRENIYINGSVLGLTRSEIDACIEEIIRFADIGQFIDQPVKSYSSGMHMRLAFGIAVNVSPDVLIIDEALAVGDARFQNKCIGKIKEFCEKGTVVFVSHNMAAVNELCSRVIWLDAGQVQMDGKPKYVTERYLQYMYEGEVESKDASSVVAVSQDSDLEMKGFVSIGDGNRQFGNLKAIAKGVRLTTWTGHTRILNGGQACTIDIRFQTHATIHRPIIGFMVKDRLGRYVLGDNSLLMGQTIPPLASGQSYLASFVFASWPNITEDDYLLAIAIAEGIMEDHMQCHYVHDALDFRSIPVRKFEGFFLVNDTRLDLTRIRGDGEYESGT